MCGDLYPKGTELWWRTTGEAVRYVGQAKYRTDTGEKECGGVHIVLASPLDFIDDGIREVREDEIVALVDPYAFTTDEFFRAMARALAVLPALETSDT
jgi:hypothetical protein